MLDAYIIDAIRREEQQRQVERDVGRRLYIEAPLYPAFPRVNEPEEVFDGPIVIPLYPNDQEQEEDAA